MTIEISEWILLVFLTGGNATAIPMPERPCNDIAEMVRAGIPVEVVRTGGERVVIEWAICIPPRNEECDE